MTKRPSLAGTMRTLREDTTPKPEALVSARLAAPEAAPSVVVEAADKPTITPTRSAPAAERYAGMKKMLIPLEEGVHRRLKALAAEEGKTLEKTVQDACAAYLEKARGR